MRFAVDSKKYRSISTILLSISASCVSRRPVMFEYFDAMAEANISFLSFVKAWGGVPSLGKIASISFMPFNFETFCLISSRRFLCAKYNASFQKRLLSIVGFRLERSRIETSVPDLDISTACSRQYMYQAKPQSGITIRTFSDPSRLWIIIIGSIRELPAWHL